MSKLKRMMDRMRGTKRTPINFQKRGITGRTMTLEENRRFERAFLSASSVTCELADRAWRLYRTDGFPAIPPDVGTLVEVVSLVLIGLCLEMDAPVYSSAAGSGFFVEESRFRAALTLLESLEPTE